MAKPTFHDRFRQLLQDNKLTPYRVAAATLDKPLKVARPNAQKPLTETHIQRWLDYRKGIPNPPTLRAMATYFGVTVDYLLGNSDDAAPADLARALADYVNQEFDARAVYRGRVRRRVHKANPDRLLRYVIAAVRAGEESDREVTAQEGTTLALHRELQTAAESLEKAGARLEDAALCEEAAHYKRSIKRIERAIREQLSPRLIQLFDAPADAPLPALTITTTPAANV